MRKELMTIIAISSVLAMTPADTFLRPIVAQPKQKSLPLQLPYPYNTHIPIFPPQPNK